MFTPDSLMVESGTVYSRSSVRYVRMMRRTPIPVSFAIVVAGLIALFIFFGAWAVSTDAAEHDRELSFALGNSGAGFGVNPLASVVENEGKAKAANEVESSADTWWGSTLLIACPLH